MEEDGKMRISKGLGRFMHAKRSCDKMYNHFVTALF